jgi:DNA replication protein DnaC
VTGQEPQGLGRLLGHLDAAKEHQAAWPERDVHPLHVPDLEDVTGASTDERRALLWTEAMPSRFLAARLDDFDGDPALSEASYRRLCDWAKHPARRNLVLFGPVGVGKSHAAVAAVRPSHEYGAEVRFLPAVELLDLLKPPSPASTLYQLASVDVLVIDELGAERATDWTDERLYALVNRRWLEELPTVVTTNLPGRTAMQEALGERVFSRLRHDAVAIEMVGADRRAPEVPT